MRANVSALEAWSLLVKSQPADLTEILRASVAAAKGGRGKSDEDDKDEKTSAKPKPRRKASA